MTDRFVVTGTGRSGTRWASEVLGVGHQAMFTGDGFVDSDAAGDSSFWAASQNLEGWRVVLLVRDPRLVVASWLATGEFTQMLLRGHWRMWQHCHRLDPTITEAAGVERLARYWWAVNYQVAQIADEVLRVEDTTPAELAVACDLDDWIHIDGPESRTEPVAFHDTDALILARELGYVG